MNALERSLCARCGSCCHGEEIDLLPEEYEQVKEYLSPGEPIRHLFDGISMININPSDKCLALDADGCRIPRRLRPPQCILFPFIIHRYEPLVLTRSNHCKNWRRFQFDSEREEALNRLLSGIVVAVQRKRASGGNGV